MLSGLEATRQSGVDHLVQHSLQQQRPGTAGVYLAWNPPGLGAQGHAADMATELLYPRVWTRQCVNPVIEWKADELTVAQTTTEGRAEADSDSRACPDGDHPPA